LHSLAQSAKVSADALRAFQPHNVDDALGHLATLADAAARLPEIEATLADVERRALRRVDDLDKRLADVVDLATRIEGGLPVLGEVLDRIGGLDARLADALEVVERLESDISSLGRIAPSVDVLTQAARQLADTAEPLQGVAERLGRITDRLPAASPHQKLTQPHGPRRRTCGSAEPIRVLPPKQVSCTELTAHLQLANLRCPAAGVRTIALIVPPPRAARSR
jgi:hypothetical protein